MTQTTNGVSANGTAVPADTSVTNPASQLGENDFLKLLVAQLQYQDPMSPTDNDQFMQEQAQFSTVEGINSLQSTMSAMQQQQELASSVALIGKQVTYTDANGTAQTGVVASVGSSDNGVTVKVGGADVDPSAISKVADDPDSISDAQALSELLQLLQQDPSSGTTDPTSTDPTTDGPGA